MSKLYLIPTPIGNLDDMTHRGIHVLKEVDLILAEDTRKSRILLKHYGIEKPLLPHHKFNEHKAVAHICEDIAGGQTAALITDAGTPGISDPGFLLVRECIRHEIAVETLPGPTAFIPALVNSGLPCERFCFEGFLPQKKGRQKRLETLREEERTMVFYESPYRVEKTLLQLAEVCGADRQASVSREISKIYEETLRGSLQQLAKHFREKPPKGEFVLVVAGLPTK